jgi:hypothetical protein
MKSKAPLSEIARHDPVENIGERVCSQGEGHGLSHGTFEIGCGIIEACVRWKAARPDHALHPFRTICRERCESKPRLVIR